MPKKISENSKAVAARDRKAAAAAEKDAKAKKDAEERQWADAEGKKSKAAAKKEDAAAKAAEAQARKAEAKRLAAEEEAALAKSAAKAGKLGKPTTPKVTHAQLQLVSDAERKVQQEAAARQRAMSKREVSEEEYARMVEVENKNRDDDLVEARSVTAAIGALSMGGDEKEDKHPEKRMKAAYNAYLERELPVLKQEKPGLRLQQYKDLIWKAWQKSPENPLNQAAKSS